MFEEKEALIQFGIKGCKVIEKALPSKPLLAVRYVSRRSGHEHVTHLREEKACEGDIDKYTLI